MIEILLGLLIIISLAEGFIIYRKVIQVNRAQQIIEQYENWIENFALTVGAIDEELDRIDAEGTFRSDDEVGFFYQSIYSILKRLSDYGIRELPEEEPLTGDAKGEETNLLYERDRELHRRI